MIGYAVNGNLAEGENKKGDVNSKALQCVLEPQLKELQWKWYTVMLENAFLVLF